MEHLLQKIESMRLIRSKLRGMAHLIEQLGYDEAPPTDQLEIYWGIGLILNDLSSSLDQGLDFLEIKIQASASGRPKSDSGAKAPPKKL